MSEPLTDVELAAMEHRAELYGRDAFCNSGACYTNYAHDVPRLIAEVERLRGDCAEWERLHDQAERLCARCGSELDRSELGGTHGR